MLICKKDKVIVCITEIMYIDWQILTAYSIADTYSSSMRKGRRKSAAFATVRPRGVQAVSMRTLGSGTLGSWALGAASLLAF